MGILVDLEGWKVSTHEEFGSNRRAVLGYISAVYDIEYQEDDTETEISIVLYYLRGKDGVWENTDPYVLDKDKKIFFQKLPPSLSVIDFYPRLYGNIEDYGELTSLKVLFKEIFVGKFG